MHLFSLRRCVGVVALLLAAALAGPVSPASAAPVRTTKLVADPGPSRVNLLPIGTKCTAGADGFCFRPKKTWNGRASDGRFTDAYKNGWKWDPLHLDHWDVSGRYVTTTFRVTHLNVYPSGRIRGLSPTIWTDPAERYPG